MSVLVAGQPAAAWCTTDRFVGPSGPWRTEPDGSVICDAPGVYIADGAVRIVLPRCYRGSETEGPAALQAALVLLRALNRYRLRADLRAVEQNWGEVGLREVGAVDDSLAWLETSLLLAEDAKRNGGLYVASTDVSPRRQGRIHWAKTQQRGFHVVDGAEVLTHPHWRSRHGIDPEDLFTQLHLDTCAAIGGALGRGFVEGRRWTSTEAVSVLDRCEKNLYADRHRLVARWLRHYWTRTSAPGNSRQSDVSALWAPNFPMVWEAMLREVMGGRPLGIPGGTYRMRDGRRMAGLRLLPDFVVDSGGLRYVVDAKHYHKEKPPATESLAKQLLYRWFASVESGHGDVPIRDVVSVFMLPCVGGKAVVDVFGDHVIDQEADLPHAFGRVWVVLTDFETVAEAYFACRRMPELVPVLPPITASGNNRIENDADHFRG